MKFFLVVFALVFSVSNSFLLKNAVRRTQVSSTSFAAAKIEILSREMDLTEPLKLRIDSKIGKVICHSSQY
jgi:hypothetical protein